ncbi:MAG: hypothetical protein K1X88_35195, partial [Nannocystaceae bacterium]|nr:hypothetical protein [Nannocystaceae bacterium]
MKRSIIVSAGLAAFALAGAARAGEPISPLAPWARTTDDPYTRGAHERRLGITREQLDALPVRREGDMVFLPEGMGADTLAALGLEPLHAMAYEAAPGILYVEMNGVTLTPTCGNGDAANAALNCSPLVDAETQFPSYGNGSAQAATFQELQNYYEPFNIVMSTQRPPDWLPYTMAVIGGASNQGGGVCGVANVACDGLKRNHVSLTFPESCGGVSETAAQETSHNWGLEHTDDQSDLMYPFNNGGFKTYVDTCNDISHATGNGLTQCGYIHEVYCPDGGGEQQNSYQELLGVFGPREVDTVAPMITSTVPEDGATISTTDSVLITATVAEDSNFLGAKWTWLEGLPEGVDEYTRCTNNVCTQDYALTPGTDPNEVAWDFANMMGAPPGTYSFKFEVMDAYGNYDSRTITVTVVEGGADGGTDTAADTGTATGDAGESADGTAGSDGADDSGGSSGGGGDGGGGAEGGDGTSKGGCACRCAAPRSPSFAWLVLVLGAAAV